MPHHTDPRWYRGDWEQRPVPLVPPEALRLAVGDTSKDFAFLFYKTFRRREEYDNFKQGHKTDPASLAYIYECFVYEYNKTVKDMVDGRIVMPERHFCRMQSSPMGWGLFNNILYNYDENYIVGKPSPRRKIDRQWDMVRIGKESYFVDNKQPNPIVTLMRNPDHKKIVESVLGKVLYD
jgi:hypothetical protein